LRNILLKDEEPFEAIALKKDGTTFSVEICSRAIPDQEGVVRVMVVREIAGRQPAEVLEVLQKARDELDISFTESTTQVRYANAQLRLELSERTRMEAELKARARQQAAVAELGQRALVGTDLSILMEEAASLLAQTLEIEYAEILELLPGGDTLLLRAGIGWQEGTVGYATVGVNSDSKAGYTLRSGGPVIVEDFATETRFNQSPLFCDRQVVSGMSVIIQGRSQPLGVLGADTTRRRMFTEDDIHFLQAVANVLAMAIERKQTEEALKKSVQDLEITYRQAMVYAQELKEEIIERKRAEATLKEERALLSRWVTERTADLSAANAELARTARLKDEFLASMSHELRTPLTAILGLSEVLRAAVYGPLNEKQLKSVSGIEESGRHLLLVINDILDLSKIGAGKFELEIGPVSVEAVCQASLQFIKQTAHQKQLKVSSAHDGTVTTLQADERRLKQILVNLLSNAVKFTPEGGEIGLEVRGDIAHQAVHFTVWDTGRGIAPEDMNRVFQPFVQLDSSLSRQYGGTGLGLALVRRMVEMHRGRVSVESKVGQGSRFTISLPCSELAKTAGSIEAAESAEIDGPGPAPLPAQPSLVLLAEDEDSVSSFLTDYLSESGYGVIIARNGAEALERAREEKPDLILMDVQMPVMNGLEATRHLRAETDLATIPIIALTALAMPGDREQCLQAGANAYLSKPVSLKDLARVIQAQLNQDQMEKENLI
jgi:signal transduction histidine kinase/ActR/RegA family two-component response regulator